MNCPNSLIHSQIETPIAVYIRSIVYKRETKSPYLHTLSVNHHLRSNNIRYNKYHKSQFTHKNLSTAKDIRYNNICYNKYIFDNKGITHAHTRKCHQIVTKLIKKFIHKAKPSIHKETLDSKYQSDVGLPQILTTTKLKTTQI